MLAFYSLTWWKKSQYQEETIWVGRATSHADAGNQDQTEEVVSERLSLRLS